jgi:hypothetical protein
MRVKTTLLAAITAFSFCLPFPSASEVGAGKDKILSAILQLKMFSPDAKISVQKADKQAVVTIYSAAYEKAQGGLLKIDAVLIAKSVFDNDADLVRTKVCFGGLKSGGTFNQVSVSKGDIKAFGSNQLSKADLLDSLEVVSLRQTSAPPKAAAAAGARAGLAQEDVELLTPSGFARGKWLSYRDAKTGLTLSYPSHWQLVEKPDKDSLFQIKSPNCALSFTYTHSPGMPVRQAVRLWENFVFPHLTDFKLINARRVRLGQNRSMEGISRLIEFKVDEVNFRQRWIFFGQTGNVFNAVITIPENASRVDIPDMYRVLLSMTFTGGTAAGQAQEGTQAKPELRPETNLTLYQTAEVTISYPRDWIVKVHPEPDVLVGFHGKTTAGDAALQIRKGPIDRTTPLDDIVSSVESHYLKQLKNYRRYRQESVELGGGASGVVQEFGFESSGIPFRQISTYRREGDFLYTMSLTASGWKPSDMLNLFNRCLGTWSVRE